MKQVWLICKTSAKLKLQLCTVLHSKTEMISVFLPIERCCLLSFCYSRMPFFHMKHETKLKCKQNVALYNPRHLNNANKLKCLMRELTLAMHKQNSTVIVNLVTLYFQLTLLLLSM